MLVHLDVGRAAAAGDIPLVLPLDSRRILTKVGSRISSVTSYTAGCVVNDSELAALRDQLRRAVLHKRHGL